VTESPLEPRIEGFLARNLPDAEAVRVHDLSRSTEGFSQETFVFQADVEFGDGTRATRGFVIKREPPAGLLEPYDLEPEFRVLHALSDHPLPSPPTLFFEADPEVLGRPFYVMERLSGDAVVPAAAADGSGPFDDAERAALLPQITGTLASLHGVDWHTYDIEHLPDPGRSAGRHELTRWEERIARAKLPVAPILKDTLLWLRAHVPSCDETTLVHGDYRLGNFLIERSPAPRLSGVLDWEMVHLGDPLEDLAWCTSELWRASTGMAAALAPEPEFLQSYTDASGRAVDEERYRFYAVLSVVKMIAIMRTGIRAFCDGRTRDLRMAIFDHQLPFLHALLAVERGWLPRGM
jgi:aminoglycoside phosphotransferase (APT) family kinase protein